MSEFEGDGFDKDGYNFLGAHRLHVFAACGNVASAEKELANGTSIDVLTKTTRSGSSSATPLQYAARNDQLQVVKFLVENKADINLFGGGVSALFDACRYSHHRIANYLVEHKADVNTGTDAGFVGATCLMVAIPRAATVQLLIDNGADLTWQTYTGASAISRALSHRHES